MQAGSRDHFSRHGSSTCLVVFVHGMSRSPSDFDRLRSEVLSWLPDADHFAPQLPLGAFSMRKGVDVSGYLRKRIDDVVAAGAYEDIILIGHSVGALMIRAAWLMANGAQLNAAVDRDLASSWTGRVRRIVLLAALGRGWQPTVAMSPMIRLVFWLTGVWEFIFLPRLLAFEHRRGAAFLTTVRLQSLAIDAFARRTGTPMPSVVQVLGTIDDLVQPSDNIDLITGADFHYLEAGDTGHLNILHPDTPARRRILCLAVTGDEAALGSAAMNALEVADLYSEALDDFDQVLPPEHRRVTPPTIDRAVMVLHGIRDYGYWTKRLAGRVKQRARSRGLECRTVTSSYGFLPMGPFLSPAVRKRRVEWFMDQYVHARAIYPEAEFGFVGHSNGTYLLAGALSACPAIRFDRVAFAGSVVRTDYPWNLARMQGQVGSVVNYVATDDLVVAGFPKFLARLRIFDLGGAGSDGFRPSPDVENVRFVAGGHGAAIVEANWDGIADYVLAGADPDTALPPAISRDRRDELKSVVASWVLVPLAVGAVVGIGLIGYGLASDLDLKTLRMLVAIAVTGAVVGTVVTKF